MKEREIAVRLFTNDKYGKTYGPGLRNKALFNASAELRKPASKYLLDFYQFEDWANKAKTDEQMMVYNELQTMGFDKEQDAVFSWIVHYDPITKAKISVGGVAIFNTEATLLRLMIADAVNDLNETWMLETVRCKNAGVGKPAYLASNVDVGYW